MLTAVRESELNYEKEKAEARNKDWQDKPIGQILTSSQRIPAPQ